MRIKRLLLVSAIVLALLVGLALVIFHLWREAPVEGAYVFRSNELMETLELKPGGKFTQQIRMGDAIYNATGYWSLKSRALTFRGSFLTRFDGSVGKTRNPPLELSFCSAYWDARHNRISFSEDYDKEYYVEKMQ